LLHFTNAQSLDKVLPKFLKNRRKNISKWKISGKIAFNSRKEREKAAKLAHIKEDCNAFLGIVKIIYVYIRAGYDKKPVHPMIK
jgi:DhnA family fructose-bisphosphate aldolase class Ia